MRYGQMRYGQINLMIPLLSEDLPDLLRSSELTRRFIGNLSRSGHVERRVLPDLVETSTLGADLWLHRRDSPRTLAMAVGMGMILATAFRR
jgi:hypothetical protein